MALYDIEPTRVGARLTLISDDRRASVSKDFDHARAEQFVEAFCQAAGLRRPWKG
jgi:hypothetical protein